MAAPGKQRIEVQYVQIDQLRADPYNPRRISDNEMEKLTRSIREFGLVDPVVVRRADRTVIGGHQRLRAARRLGLTTVPVVFVDLSGEQARLLNLALNRISGEWDEELLGRLDFTMAMLDLAHLSRTVTGKSEAAASGTVRAFIYGDDGTTVVEQCDGPIASGACPRGRPECAVACAGRWILAEGWRFRVAPEAAFCPVAELVFARPQSRERP